MEKRGQVWVETVLYTLIALALIGLVLAFITPRLNEARDRAVVDQTVSALNIFDEKINAVLRAPGNVRIVDFTLKRGKLVIDGQNDIIYITINDLSSPYSEPGAKIEEGRVSIVSERVQKLSSVTLTLNYGGLADITYDGTSSVQNLSQAAVPYKLSVENKGADNTVPQIDIKQIS